jgi:GNAT superfamily N-acetyltransferase
VSAPTKLRFHPLTPARWDDLEQLFGSRGACAGCWCMWWRLPRAQWSRQRGEGNRRAFRALVRSGSAPGVLAYLGSKAVGWCAVAPREAYGGLSRSRVLKPVDDEPVWSVTCFYVAREHRRRGITVGLLGAAAKLAASRGARRIEGYPVEPRRGESPDAWVYTGLVGAFRKAGFQEVARRSATRPIMRRALRRGPRKGTAAARARVSPRSSGR